MEKLSQDTNKEAMMSASDAAGLLLLSYAC
jgi:hypothetical protein